MTSPEERPSFEELCKDLRTASKRLIDEKGVPVEDEPGALEYSSEDLTVFQAGESSDLVHPQGTILVVHTERHPSLEIYRCFTIGETVEIEVDFQETLNTHKPTEEELKIAREVGELSNPQKLALRRLVQESVEERLRQRAAGENIPTEAESELEGAIAAINKELLVQV